MGRQETNNIQADLADLRGARFVLTSETEHGQRLAEGRLKRITQGTGRIKAVRKYENPIEFEETHKLWIDANHRPAVNGHDDAIWNRLRLIPFSVTIRAQEIDRELSQKLLEEAEGILAWAVCGAMRWYEEGLGSNALIEQTSRVWRSESDPLSRFLSECCRTEPNAATPAQDLYQGYRAWAGLTGEEILTATAFGRRMSGLGYARQHTERGTAYRGLALRDSRS